MDERRATRVAEAIRDELAEIINYELEDPRIGAVDVVDVHLSPDAKSAHVRVIAPGAESVAALEHAKGYLRRQVAARLDLFHTPDFRFVLDFSRDQAPRLHRLLKRARKGRPKEAAG